MIIFAISFLLVWITSYFITSLIKPNKDSLGILYLFLISFAQIIAIFEFLSLFSAIKASLVFILNFVFFALSMYFWIKNGKKIWIPDFSATKAKINNSFKLDKSLGLLYFAYCFLIIVVVCLCFMSPISNMDAWSYHAARCLFWIKNGNLNHFVISDIRNLCLPINSELLYTWVFLLVKKDVFMGFFSFAGYIISVISLYSIMSNIGFCTRKKLWAIFVMSAFASVIVQMSGTETDIIISGLVLSSVALFWHAVKNFPKTTDRKETIYPLFMSALAYAVAIGTKTTAFFMIPAVAILMLFLCKKYIKEKSFKPFLYFLGFGTINFLIFASYNYILNIIDYHSLSGPQSFIVVSRNYYGIKGLIYNLVRNCTQMIDTTGFKWGTYLNAYMTNISNIIINFLHVGNVKNGLFSLSGNYLNASMLEPLMGPGILGTFVFIPCLIWGFLKPVKEKMLFDRKIKNKTLFLFIFSGMFVLNLIVMSYLLCYMNYSIRFITSFMVVASPILVYSYFKRSRVIKPLIILFALFYFIITSMNIWARPFYSNMVFLTKYHFSLSELRELNGCGSQGLGDAAASCALRNYIRKSLPKASPMLVFSNNATGLFFIFRENLNGYHLDSGLLEDISNIDLDKYEYLAIPYEQISTVVKHYNTRSNDCKTIDGKVYCVPSKNNVPCIYKQNNDLPEIAKSIAPYSVLCSMTNSYLNNHNLKLVQYVLVLPKSNKQYPVKKEKITFIYKNLNYRGNK